MIRKEDLSEKTNKQNSAKEEKSPPKKIVAKKRTRHTKEEKSPPKKAVAKNRTRRTKEMRKYLAIAEKLAVRRGYDDNEIVEELGGAVSKRWTIRWRKKLEWDRRHDEWVKSAEAISEKALYLLGKEVDTWERLGRSEADTLIKAVKAIKGIDEEVDILGSTMTVLSDMMDFYQYQVKDEKAFNILKKHIPDFTQYMRNKYKK